MLKRKLYFLVLGFLASLAPVAKAKDRIPLTLQKSIDCMVEVLKAEPGVRDISAGLKKSIPSSSGTTKLPPFVEYGVLDNRGKAIKLHFDSIGMSKAGKPVFQIVLPGIFAEGAKGPDDFGTSQVEKKWKSRCGIEALSMFV